MKVGLNPIDRSKEPPLFNLIWMRTSIVAHALQYISTLLAGPSDCLRLLWQLGRGCSSIGEWFRKFDSDVRLVRRLLLLVGAWLDRRLLEPMLKDWQLFGLGDGRRSVDHAGIQTEFMSKKACCKKRGLGRQLRQTPNLDFKSMQEGFRLAAHIVWLSIVSLARTNIRLPKQN